MQSETTMRKLKTSQMTTSQIKERSRWKLVRQIFIQALRKIDERLKDEIHFMSKIRRPSYNGLRNYPIIEISTNGMGVNQSTELRFGEHYRLNLIKVGSGTYCSGLNTKSYADLDKAIEYALDDLKLKARNEIKQNIYKTNLQNMSRTLEKSELVKQDPPRPLSSIAWHVYSMDAIGREKSDVLRTDYNAEENAWYISISPRHSHELKNVYCGANGDFFDYVELKKCVVKWFEAKNCINLDPTRPERYKELIVEAKDPMKGLL